MVIPLKRKIFIEHPIDRFTEQNKVPKDVFNRLVYRKNVLEYSMQELTEYYKIKTGKRMQRKVMWLWMARLNVYCSAQIMIGRGFDTIDSAYFGNLKQYVESEYTHHSKRTKK